MEIVILYKRKILFFPLAFSVVDLVTQDADFFYFCEIR